MVSPFQFRLSRLWFCGVIRKVSGTSKASSTSPLLNRSAKPRPHTSEHRQDAMAERGHVNVEITEWLDKAGGGRDPPPGPGEGGGRGVFGRGINFARGKRNLPRMGGKVVGYAK